MSQQIAVLIKIAAAIAEELQGDDFQEWAQAQLQGGRLCIERGYVDWDEDLKDLENELRVDVVPVIHRESVMNDRATTSYTCDVDVAIRKKFPNECRDGAGRLNVAELDKLILLEEKIHDFFCHAGNGRRLASYPDAVWQATQIRLSYNRKHLRELGQFTGIVRLTYRAPQ